MGIPTGTGNTIAGRASSPVVCQRDDTRTRLGQERTRILPYVISRQGLPADPDGGPPQVVGIHLTLEKHTRVGMPSLHESSTATRDSPPRPLPPLYIHMPLVCGLWGCSMSREKGNAAVTITAAQLSSSLLHTSATGLGSCPPSSHRPCGTNSAQVAAKSAAFSIIYGHPQL